MGGKRNIRILARRPLCYPGFARKLFAELKINERFQTQDILYLTPNKRRALSAEFEIISLYPGGTSRIPDCLTLQTLAEKLVTAQAEKGIVDERDRRFILLKLIRESKERLFREEHLGLLSELYAELKRYHPDCWNRIPAVAQEVIFDSGTSIRLTEAIRLLEFYERRLAEHELVDHEMLLEQAVPWVSSLSQRLMIVEGYFEPWIAEQRLFNALLAHIPNALVILPDDPIAAKGEGFFLCYDLVQGAAPPPSPQPESSWGRWPSREDEVVAIARKICALAGEAGCRPGEIVVVFPALSTYRPVVERVFARYGLSADVSLRPKLEEQPGIQQVLDLLRTVEQGFRRRDVVGILLSHNFIRIPPSVRRWVDILSREEGIISGETQWESWFGSSAPRVFKDKREGAMISSGIREFVTRLVKELKLLNLSSAVEDFAAKLKAVLEWLGWNVTDDVGQGFEEALEKLHRITELAGELSISPRFVREILEVLFQKELPESNSERGDSIRVMPVVESRWLDARYLFVGGLVDGEFPQRSRRDLLVPERLRAKLGIPGVEEEFSNSEFEFRRLLSMPHEHVFLSAPTMEGDRPLLTSVFLEEREENSMADDKNVYCEEEKQSLEPLERAETGEGVIFTDEQSLRLIDTRFGTGYPFKVTHLETYHGCPYRYYLGTVLRIEPSEEPTQEPEARLLGTIMHEVLECLFKENPAQERLEERLCEVLMEKLDRRRLNPFLRLWVEDWARIRLDWLREEESARMEEGWRISPEWLERNMEFYFAREGFRLKGRVDRVDWRNSRARVIDYKTGKEKYFKQRIESGESLQLPLYSEMIRRLYNVEIASFGIYGFQESRIEEWREPESAMLASVGFAREIINGIRQGRFGSLESQICRFCEFNEFC